jgi:hypothetical protein
MRGAKQSSKLRKGLATWRQTIGSTIHLSVFFGTVMGIGECFYRDKRRTPTLPLSRLRIAEALSTALPCCCLAGFSLPLVN